MGLNALGCRSLLGRHAAVTYKLMGRTAGFEPRDHSRTSCCSEQFKEAGFYGLEDTL